MGRSKFSGVPGFVWVLLTPATIALIEIFRILDIPLPIPFLLLLISTIIPAGAAGLTVGLITGLISSAYIVYASYFSYGPPTLVGGTIPVFSGVAVYFGTSVFIGWVSRYQSLKLATQNLATQTLQNLVDAHALELTEANQRFRDFAAASSDWFWEMGPDLRFTWFSEDMESKIGVPTAWVIGKNRDELLHQSFSFGDWATHKDDLRHRRPFRDFRYHANGPAGEKWFSISGLPVFADDDSFAGYRGVGSDITDQVAIETQAANTLALLAKAIEGLEDAFVIWGPDDNLVMCNQAFRSANGKIAELIHPGLSFQAFVEATIAIIPSLDSPQKRAAFLKDRLAQHRNPKGPRERYLPDGRVMLIKEQILDDGSVASVAMDITERRAVQQRLMASQRLEAIGQLTGGVAHDFNNLLAVIQGNAELMSEVTGETNEMLDAILRASTKGAVLTGQLLAFSRKQPLRPTSVNISDAVTGLAKMASRTLGERIILECRVAPNLWDAMIDPTQIDAVLMNLLVNSRDAMPDGGNIVIECSNTSVGTDRANPTSEISAGDYVLLSVSDSGSGMSKETLARAFEPFFTTKDVGKGSGMGLSMVHGFAQQSGGHVTIYSELGRGTTVNLYLPRSAVASVSAEARATPEDPGGSGETILILEDDPDVLNIATLILEQLGYKTQGVPDVDHARELFATGFRCDLVLSDVIMPGTTSGPQFAKELAATHPDLKFIFMSGFPEAAAKRNGFVGSDSVLLNKPFHRHDLATAVQDALEGKPGKP